MIRRYFAKAVCGVAALTAWIAVSASAAEPAPAARDTLVYKDGDRVQGRLVEQAGGVWVFKSERFGELRVPVADAEVTRGGTMAVAGAPAASAAAPKPAAPAPASVASKAAAAAHHEEEQFSAAALTQRVRTFFGPWHGRFTFSTEVVTDIAERNNSSYEGFVRRKWTVDEVQINGRLDYNQTNNVATTDLLKLWGHWRHEFSKVFFAQYRPTSEWNRASRLRGLPNDYVLVQQEAGVGYQFITQPKLKTRFGMSQNRFDTWNSSLRSSHAARNVRSLFEEVEISLPWRMAIAQRGVWYPVPQRIDGWENRFDLNKKLTETLSTSVRHEIRRNNPDGSAPDYTRLKFLFGLDF